MTDVRHVTESAVADLYRDDLQPRRARPTEPAAMPPPPEPESGAHPSADRSVDGGTFILDAPTTVPAVWGEGQRVLWSEGEPLLLAGPPGVGKTTVAQQLMLGRVGLRDRLLDLPVAPGERVLYVAADRPAQAARSMRRMVRDDQRGVLADRLVVWRGPLPFTLAAEPERLLGMAQHYRADTVVLDSLKDVAPGLEKPEVGAAVNVALQGLVAEGVEVVALHHRRKATADNRRPRTLDDVFGSAWLAAGAGSVAYLYGQAGDPLVELLHLKQPAEDVGPLTLLHDHTTGTTTLQGAIDVLALLRATTSGLTARSLAELLTDSPEPDKNAVEKARRRLDALVRAGHAHRRDGSKGGEGGGTAARYHATDDRREEPR